MVIGDNFSHVIANISRLSYRKGKYISTWKIGKVTTVFKNGDKEDCGNYRPLAMLNIPSKITESVVRETLDKHLENVIQDKSEVMIIRKNTFISPLLPVRSGNMIIKYTNTTTILGITIDNRITWKQQVDKVSKSFSAKIRVLKKLRFLKQKQLEEIYYKTIIPEVTYCISVWGTALLLYLTTLKNST